MTANSHTSSNALTEVDTQSVSEREPPHWQVVAPHALITPAVLHHHYNGSGTKDDPHVVEFLPNDPLDFLKFSLVKKWLITLLVAVATLTVASVSSACSGAIIQTMQQFGTSEEVVTLGVSLFVLGVSTAKSAKSDGLLSHIVVCNWPFTMGASIRALWPSNSFSWNLRCAYRL